MAEKLPEYRIGVWPLRWREYNTITPSDGGEAHTVKNYPIREVTRRWGPFSFSKRTGYSLEVGDSHWLRREVQVVNEDSGSIPKTYHYSAAERAWVGHVETSSQEYFGALKWFPFTKRAAARTAVKDLGVVEFVGRRGEKKKRPGFRRGKAA